MYSDQSDHTDHMRISNCDTVRYIYITKKYYDKKTHTIGFSYFWKLDQIFQLFYLYISVDYTIY